VNRDSQEEEKKEELLKDANQIFYECITELTDQEKQKEPLDKKSEIKAEGDKEEEKVEPVPEGKPRVQSADERFSQVELAKIFYDNARVKVTEPDELARLRSFEDRAFPIMKLSNITNVSEEAFIATPLAVFKCSVCTLHLLGL
jgi:hypothetical protein